jgi:hypothetical protein
VGNAWRLENAVLIARTGNADVFLGHGSGRKTAAEMRAKLAEEYNDVARRAIRLTRAARRGAPAARAAAKLELATRFPGVVLDGTTWKVRGTGLRGVAVDEPLKLLRPSQIPGLFDPATPGIMYADPKSPSGSDLRRISPRCRKAGAVERSAVVSAPQHDADRCDPAKR